MKASHWMTSSWSEIEIESADSVVNNMAKELHLHVQSQTIPQRTIQGAPTTVGAGWRAISWTDHVSCAFNGPISKQVLAFLIGVAQMPLFPE